MPTGAQILIEQLVAEGVAHVFTVPGESFLAALDAMHGSPAISPITCRNEGGAAMMAEATGKLLGAPGVALVTRGPGAANAVAGVYIAHQDATPMLLLVGLPPRRMHGLPAFQNIDITALFGSIAKWCAVVPSAAELARHLQEAFSVANSGRPGPVVLGLPEDVLLEIGEATAPTRPMLSALAPPPGTIEHLRLLLASAETPLVIAGSSVWGRDAARGLATFADTFDIPVITSFRRQDHIDNRHRCYVGHAGLGLDPVLATGIRASDLLIVFGDALGDITTQGFTLVQPPHAKQKIVHIAQNAGEDFGLYVSNLAIRASPELTALALAKMPGFETAQTWATWRRDLRSAYQATKSPKTTPGKVRLEEIIAMLSDTLPPSAIVCNGAGNYAAFLHRYFSYKSYPTQLAPVAGSMGYGLPAAIAAKLMHPERTVVALAGDGCFQMTQQELQTAVQFGLPIVIIIANNGTLGTIRMHQEYHYPGRVIATSLINPDFAALAQSCGAHGERVNATAEFPAALERALSSGKTAVIELKLDPEAISPNQTITNLRAVSKMRSK